MEGRTRGGSPEIVSRPLTADREIRSDESAYDGRVLFPETSEELPRAEEVFRVLRDMGGRGLLRRFPALLAGRPRTWSLEHRSPPEERARHAREQREAVLRALEAYAPETMAAFDVDLGHTGPRAVIPYGGTARVDGPGRRITVTYRDPTGPSPGSPGPNRETVPNLPS